MSVPLGQGVASASVDFTARQAGAGYVSTEKPAVECPHLVSGTCGPFSWTVVHNKFNDSKFNDSKFDDSKFNENKFDRNKFDENKFDRNKFNENKFNENKFDRNKFDE
ncbi:hypothetical protein ACWDRB_03785, partial [Nonomuraea sp. NPDC003707]